MCDYYLFVEILTYHLDKVFYLERLGHKLIAAGYLGLADVFLEGVGAEGDDWGVRVDLLDDTCGVETIHLGHTDIHKDKVGMLFLVECYGLDTIVGTDKAVTLVEHDLNQLVVAILVLGHKNGLLVHIVGTAADTDGADIAGGGVANGRHATDGAFERKVEVESGAMT